jgi:hypothetical protein
MIGHLSQKARDELLPRLQATAAESTQAATTPDAPGATAV